MIIIVALSSLSRMTRWAATFFSWCSFFSPRSFHEKKRVSRRFYAFFHFHEWFQRAQFNYRHLNSFFVLFFFHSLSSQFFCARAWIDFLRSSCLTNLRGTDLKAMFKVRFSWQLNCCLLVHKYWANHPLIRSTAAALKWGYMKLCYDGYIQNYLFSRARSQIVLLGSHTFVGGRGYTDYGTHKIWLQHL